MGHDFTPRIEKEFNVFLPVRPYLKNQWFRCLITGMEEIEVAAFVSPGHMLGEEAV